MGAVTLGGDASNSNGERVATLAGARAALGALARQTGGRIGEAARFKVDQREEDIFACLIGDYDPMHNDPGWTFEGGWDSTIVLGFHVLSFLHRFLGAAGVPVQAGDGHVFTSVGLDRVRFVSSMPVGSEAEWQVSLQSVEDRGDARLIRTSHQVQIPGAARPMMVAEHIGAVMFAPPHLEEVLDEKPRLISAIPTGSPIAESVAHGERFYRGVVARAGDWLGATPWTVIDKRGADLFNLLSGAPEPIHSDPAWDRQHSPWGTTVVHPFHLLALRSFFLPQVGLPVLTDDWMAAFNYGLDRARWYAQVPAGTRLRDHVQILEGREKDPGRYLVKTRHVVEREGEPRAVMSADTLTLFALKAGAAGAGR
jgi:acyl dehydratase